MAGDNKKAGKVTLSTDDLAALIDEIKAIDEKLGALKGTASEWMKKGDEAARGTDLGQFVGHQDFSVTFVIGDGDTVGSHVDAVRSYLEDAEQFGKELATAWIRANRTDGDESTALRQRRDSLVTDAESRRNIFAQLLGPDSVAEFEIPKAPSSRSGGGGSSTPKKAGSMSFYRVKDGERVPQSSQQDSLSSMAYYYFTLKDDTGEHHASVGDLRAAIEKQHGKVDETKDWEGSVELNGKTWTIGWYLVKADETPDQQVTDTPVEGGDK